MSPQHSNREALIEGALCCIEAKPSANITARDISAASGANLASIAYHFGSKEALLTQAMEEGLRRWLVELASAMGDLTDLGPSARLQRAIDSLQSGLENHRGLVHAFFAAVARAPHDETLRNVLALSYTEARDGIAVLLDLGEDPAGSSAASLVLAAFDGLLIQSLVGQGGLLDTSAIRVGIERLSMLSSESNDTTGPK